MNSRHTNWLLEEKYNGVQSAVFLHDCERIVAGEPLDYVIGFTRFLGCHIDLSERPLIPRPETEWWVEQVIKIVGHRMSYRASDVRALDMFSGSGCIGIALMKHLPQARVDFVDIEDKCIRQIQKNCTLNDIAPVRFKVIQSDMFAALEDENYDVILANPPYVASCSHLVRVDPSVLYYEPHGALFSGEDGLEHIREFLREAPKHLAPRGLIAMEFDDIQKDDIEKFIMENSPGTAKFHRDQYGRYRWLTYARV